MGLNRLQHGATTKPYLAFARAKRLLTPKSDATLRRLTRGSMRLSSMERNAVKYMLDSY